MAFAPDDEQLVNAVDFLNDEEIIPDGSDIATLYSKCEVKNLIAGMLAPLMEFNPETPPLGRHFLGLRPLRVLYRFARFSIVDGLEVGIFYRLVDLSSEGPLLTKGNHPPLNAFLLKNSSLLWVFNQGGVERLNGSGGALPLHARLRANVLGLSFFPSPVASNNAVPLPINIDVLASVLPPAADVFSKMGISKKTTAEVTQTSLQSQALPLFNLLLNDLVRFQHIVGPTNSICSIETHQRVINLLSSEFVALPALQVGKNLTYFLSFHWSLQLAESTSNVFNGMSLCLFLPFDSSGFIQVFSSSLQLGVALNSFANVCDCLVGGDSQFYISCFSPVISILSKQSQVSLSNTDINVLVEFFNRLMNNKICPLFHNSLNSVSPIQFGQLIMESFLFDVVQTRLELLITHSPPQFSNNKTVSIVNKKRGISKNAEVNVVKAFKKVSSNISPLPVVPLPVKKGSAYCVNHVAKWLAIPGAKGCLPKTGGVCGRKHISRPVPGQLLDAAIKADLKFGISTFAVSFKNPFLLALDAF
jgi:hypothetical protein